MVVTGWRAVAVVTALTVVSASGRADAQPSRRIAFDTVIGVQDFLAETSDWPTSVIVDPFVGVELWPGVQGSARAKVWRTGGDWHLLLDQASIRYNFRAGANWRIEAGRFPSPIGLGMTENRASLNGSLIWCHRPYYMALPDLGAGAPDVSLISAMYPDGLSVAVSSTHWDARAALVNAGPVEFWHGDTGADRHANLVIGGGVTPTTGLRLGVAAALGDLTDAPAGTYRMVNVEGDYSVGYTRISGEVTSDQFVMPAGRHHAWGWTLQVQRTLSPRVFAHVRASTVHAPEALAAGPVTRKRFHSVDSTVGYRVDPEVTLRLGYTAVAAWDEARVDHQAGVSLVWSRRWW